MFIILVASVTSFSHFMLSAITSRLVIKSFRRVTSMLAPILKYAATLGRSDCHMGCFGRTVCHPGKEMVLFSWLIFSHQGSCTRNMLNTGSLLSAIIYIAVCVAAFDQFTFKLQSKIREFDLACPLIGMVLVCEHL